MHRNYYILVLTLIISNLLYSFGGRPITVEEVRPYYTASDTAKIEIFVYTNLSDNTNYNYLTLAIADSIANQLEYNKTIRLQSSTNVKLTPVDFERAYERKVFQFTNITYTATDSSSNIAIVTNYEYYYYTNWGGLRSNVTLITPETKYFQLNEEEEVIINYNGSNVIVKNTNDFVQNIELGGYFYEYTGDDIKKEVFKRDADIVIFGSIEYKRPNISVITSIAYVKERKIDTYSIEISEAKIDEQIPIYALDIANRISYVDKTGTIAINVEPEGAFVYVDNALIGMSGDTLYLPTLTTNAHRFTIKKDLYETIDTMLSFEKTNEDIMLNFSMVEMTNTAKVKINIPGGEDSSVVINGIKRKPANFIYEDFGFGTYSIKITNTNYIDYYGTFTVKSTNYLDLTPKMKPFHEPTWVDIVFKNYERNTKIFLGLTIASTIFSVGTYIYANEILDYTMINYYDKYQNAPNRPPVDLTTYNTAFNIYIGGLVATGVFALTAGIYYMLWVNESNFSVEELTFSGGYGGANVAYTYRW